MDFWAIISLVTLIIQIAGVYYALQAIMMARTPQSAIGWGLALLVFPILALPLFWVFGESRFGGYTLAGTQVSPELDEVLKKAQDALAPFNGHLPAKYSDTEILARNLKGLPVTSGNRVKLLIDGSQTFPSIFEALDAAKKSIVVQFYVVHDDGVGKELKKHLLAAAARGVKCRVLYDKVGSKGLPDSYVNELRAGGVDIHTFTTNRQHGFRFQINFRNHRKLVLVDDHIAFLGGLNIGDEYIGKGPLGEWRDTHIKIEGPAARGLLVCFLEDWHYIAHEIPDIPCDPKAAGDQQVLTFASGPAEAWSVTPAVYCEIIHDVERRLWIASPYFVPDQTLRTALAHAALRGVDVRILLPQGIDHLLPWLSSFTYYPQMLAAGVKIYRYQPGFMHQKVLLADDDVSIVGSVNTDYRSFMLNFELAAVVNDRTFAKEIENMFMADFTKSKEEDLATFATGSFWFRLKCRLAALMSPEQ